MSERAAYSRVYWSIVDDAKFVAIYDDDHHLAAWLRLLLIADQSYPASAHLPSNVRKTSVKALSDVGLVDVSGSRYRVRGLEAERQKRRDAATRLPPRRDPDGTQTGGKREPDGPYTSGLSRAEDEPSQDEVKPSRDTARDPASTYWTLTGKYPVGNSLSWIDQLAQAFGPESVADELANAFAEDPRVSTLIGRTQDRLRAGTRTPQPKKPRVLEPWQEEFRASIQAQYDHEGPIVPEPVKRETA